MGAIAKNEEKLMNEEGGAGKEKLKNEVGSDEVTKIDVGAENDDKPTNECVGTFVEMQVDQVNIIAGIESKEKIIEEGLTNQEQAVAEQTFLQVESPPVQDFVVSAESDVKFTKENEANQEHAV